MDAQQIIKYHVNRAKDCQQDVINRRKSRVIRNIYKSLRNTHMAMAREVKRLSNMADAYEAL